MSSIENTSMGIPDDKNALNYSKNAIASQAVLPAAPTTAPTAATAKKTDTKATPAAQWIKGVDNTVLLAGGAVVLLLLVMKKQ